MHGKNISMLHLPDGTTMIAPAYDVVPQTHLDAGGMMALSINRKYAHAAISLDDLVAEGESWGVRAPRAVITDTLEVVAAFVRAESPAKGAYGGLQDDIARFTGNLLDGRATGYTP